jgi:ligand-binding sensor domain-containing protein
MTVCALLAPGASLAESGDWEIFVNASAINRINCIGDSIWCSTRGGILIFNLGDSSFVQHLDGLGFRSTDVSGVTRDTDGSVWAGFTTSGVARIDHFGSARPEVKLYTTTIDGLLSDSVTCIASAGDDVYYGSTSGIAKFYDNLHSLEPILSDSLEGVHVREILVRGDTLWIACERGVARFLRSTFDYTMYRIGRSTSLCIHGGAVHVAGTNGVRRFDGSAWVSLGLPGGSVPLSVASGAGALYCVTAAKAYRRDGSSWTDITANMKTMFSQKYTIWSGFDLLKTIAVDPRGTVWVAGLEAQINRGSYLSAFLSNSWINKAPENLSQNGVVALSVVTGQGIWASTRYFGVSYRSNGGRWETYSKMRTSTDEAGLSYYLNNIAFLRDSQGFLWCGAFLDLDRIKINDPFNKADDEWEHYALNEGTITTNRFVRAKEDPEGNRWFLSDDVLGEEGLLGINILKADGTAWLSVTPSTAPGMAGGSVFDVSFGAGGVAYLALRGYGVQAWYTGGFDWAHLSDLASDGWNTLIEPGDLASKELYAIESGSDGAVWVGTASGLVRWRSWKEHPIDSFTVMTRPGEVGLIGAAVFDLEFDGAGNLWVGTEQGLNKITPDGTIEAFTSAEAWKGDLYPSSVISPLPSHICGTLAYDRDANVLWIGTANGLARFAMTPAREVEKPLSRMILYPNPVHISRGDTEVKIKIWGISDRVLERVLERVSIRVYTIEGELVDSQEGAVKIGDKVWRIWDLLTLNGFKARSGIYVVTVSDGRSTEIRKIAIIR